MSLDAAFYSPSITTLAEAKDMALEQLRRIAVLNEERGVVVNDLMPVDPGPDVTFATDADSQSKLWEAYQALARGTITTVEWEDTDGAFHELEQPLVDDFGEQAAQCMVAFVCACRSHHAALAAIINACTTVDQVLEVDLSDGWPSNVCAGGLPHGNPYVLSFDAPGVPADDMIVFHHTFRMAVNFPADMSNSAVSADVAATATTDLLLKKNTSTTVGTVRFAAAGTSATFIGFSASSWAVGDLLTLVAPATADATLADLHGTLMGVR